MPLDHAALVGIEGAGLVDDLGRDADLPDVVQQGDELRLPPFLRRNAEVVAHAQYEIDDMAAVASRVRVVGFDDVPEQERRSAICLRELERVVDARTPLAGEERDEPEQRQREEKRV